MEEIIKEMIEYAGNTHDYKMAEIAAKLLSKFAETWNCPSNWKNLGEELAEEYNGNDWIMENCKLYDYI